MKNIASVKLQINDLDHRIDILHERSYNPDISTSELKEINKRKKKLQKNRQKLVKKVEQYYSN
tara:strand:+ start:223 stop:411 length:189 start_codon:yes stop_codon:yes gene_type:complete